VRLNFAMNKATDVHFSGGDWLL